MKCRHRKASSRNGEKERKRKGNLKSKALSAMRRETHVEIFSAYDGVVRTGGEVHHNHEGPPMSCHVRQL